MKTPEERAEEIIQLHKKHGSGFDMRFQQCKHAAITIKSTHEELKRLGVNQPEIDDYYEKMLQYLLDHQDCYSGKK